jgi:hypothetical protein
VVLFGTQPFVDLAHLELSTAGLKEYRMAVFGPVLGDRTESQVTERAIEMAAEIGAWLRP